MKIHRLVIDSWPTPDGKPFKDQPDEVWQAAVDHYLVNEGGEWPSWLPESLDITEWMPDEGEYGNQQYPAKSGDLIGEFGALVMVVPRAPSRLHFSELQFAAGLERVRKYRIPVVADQDASGATQEACAELARCGWP